MIVTRENSLLRQRIVTKAADLFIQQGYAATSIKDIAKAAGCATSALYYYFEGGKNQIWQEVAQSFALEITRISEVGREANSLEEFLVQFGEAASVLMPQILAKTALLRMDFPKIFADEQMSQSKMQIALQQMVARSLERFISDKTKARQLAWLIICAYFGYGELFFNSEGFTNAPIKLAEYSQILASVISKASSTLTS